MGSGAIGVRAAGLKDHPVVIRSGGWQSPTQMTGTKEELGQYATEFGGLAPGEYIVELVDWYSGTRTIRTPVEKGSIQKDREA